MTDLTDMWEALEAHQHIADHYGYGEAWARMCKERTANAANAASAASAAYAANAAAYAGYAAEADYHSKKVITYITKANDGLAYVHSLLNEGEKM